MGSINEKNLEPVKEENPAQASRPEVKKAIRTRKPRGASDAVPASGRAKKTSANPNLKVPGLQTVKDYARRPPSSSIIAKAFQKKINPAFQEKIEIPAQYGTTRLALMPRDPYWVYATWEIAEAQAQAAKNFLGDENARAILRVYDVTFVEFNGRNANHSFDIDVGFAASWYVNLWTDNIRVCAELGLKSSSGDFIPIIRSNVVQTPAQSISWRTEQIWMEVKDEKPSKLYVEGYDHDPQYDSETNFIPALTDMRYKNRRRYYISARDVQLYYEKLMPRLRDSVIAKIRATLGKKVRLIGSSLWDRKRLLALLKSKWFRKWQSGASEEMIEMMEDLEARGGQLSPGGASEQVGASASLQITPKRKFFFEIWADLIVYGRTEPDATVKLGETNIPLRSDGTFTLRYTLPDGKMPFDFTATSFDQLEERSISTEVNRNTFVLPPVMLQGKLNQ